VFLLAREKRAIANDYVEQKKKVIKIGINYKLVIQQLLSSFLVAAFLT
jgi:hypothetical protein